MRDDGGFQGNNGMARIDCLLDLRVDLDQVFLYPIRLAGDKRKAQGKN